MIPRMLPDPWLPYGYHIGQALSTGVMSSFATGNWSAANRALYVPVIFPVDTTVYAVYARSNSATGNYDLGLYGPDLAAIARKGSTANASAILTLSVSDVRVLAGYTYWIAFSLSATQSFYRAIVDDDSQQIMMEGAMEESALPLPATMTPIHNTTTQVPLVALGVR